jgi:hypothetical protein
MSRIEKKFSIPKTKFNKEFKNLNFTHMANQNSAWARGLEPFSFGKVHQNMAIPHEIQKLQSTN